MKDSKRYLVGQELDDDPPSVLTKDERGSWFVTYADTKIDLLTLDCDRRYTYIGNIEYRMNEAGGKVRVRHLDPRVNLAIRMYRLHQRDMFLDQQDKSRKIVELVSWLDGSNMDKSGRSDFSMQIVPHVGLFKLQRDKQKAYIRNPISTCITWQTESTDVVSVLCRITAEDIINMASFEWNHPDGYTISFTYKYYVADNKAANAALGKQIGGKKKCKHCNSNFSTADQITDYVKCMHFANECPVEMKIILDRASQYGRKELPKHSHGLKRISGFFYDYFCPDRVRHTVPEDYHAVFNTATLQHLRSILDPSHLPLLKEALAMYERMDKLYHFSIRDDIVTCKLEKQEIGSQVTLVELQFQLHSVFQDLKSGNVDAKNIADILFVLIYIHFNRNDMKLSDFGLHNLLIISDAPHNIAGLDDRLHQFLMDEVTSNKVLCDDRYMQYKGNTRTGMNHSDKRRANLLGSQILLGQDGIVSKNVKLV